MVIDNIATIRVRLQICLMFDDVAENYSKCNYDDSYCKHFWYKPERMVEHHSVEHQEKMMRCQEAVVEPIAHLSTREIGYCEQRYQHHAAGKSRGCCHQEA